jgi:heat-inducible transcriptional repressor
MGTFGRSKPSERDSQILRDVIHTFIETGEPVSSGSVARSERHGLCAASIRNVMAEMEECGYLFQPHTSAGRVPTTAGYHYYIDSLMPNREVPAQDRQYIREHFDESVSRVDDCLGMATHLLNDLSKQIGVLLTPHIGDATLKALYFVRLSGKKVLCVLESSGGVVESREIETMAPLQRDELTRISNFLTDNFSGLTLRVIRDRLLQMMREDRNELDELVRNAISLAQKALGTDDTPCLLVEGTVSVIGQPELSDVPRVKRLLETFADKAELVQMLNQILESRGPCVIIGGDSDLTSDLDFSLVATTYGTSERTLGTLGIFGPSRMSYQRVVPLVTYLGETVSEVLEND